MSKNLIKTMLAQSLARKKTVPADKQNLPMDQVIWSKTGALLADKFKSPSFFTPYQFKTEEGRASFLLDLATGPLIIVLGSTLSALTALIGMIPATLMFARAIINYLTPSVNPDQKKREVYESVGVGFGYLLIGAFSPLIETIQFMIKLISTLNHAMMKSADPSLLKSQESTLFMPESAGVLDQLIQLKP